MIKKPIRGLEAEWTDGWNDGQKDSWVDKWPMKGWIVDMLVGLIDWL